MKKLITAALTALAITTTAANAATIKAIPDQCHNPDGGKCYGIHLDGKITIDDFKTFHDLVTKNRITNAVVFLNSDGGNMLGGILIGMDVYKMGFSTYVEDDNYCVSMCASIWIAGTTKLAATTANIGFHTVYETDRRGRKHVVPQAVAIMKEYYLKVGVPKQAVDFLVSASPEEVYWLNDKLADGFGIEVTTLAKEKAKEDWEIDADKAEREAKEGDALNQRKYPEPNRAAKGDKLQPQPQATLPKSLIDELTSHANSGKL